MNTYKIIKASIKTPSSLLEARQKKGGKIFLLMLFLSFILSLPVVYQAMNIVNSIKNDGDQIIQKLPEFSIQEGHLVTKEKDTGFIFQTDSMIFTFDPDGKRNKQDVESDSVGNAMIVALMSDELILSLPTFNSTTDVFDNNTFVLPYSTPQLQHLNNTVMVDIFEGKNNVVVFLIVVISSMIMLFLNLLIDLLLLSFFANIFSKFRMVGLRLKDVFKIMVFAAVLPTIFTTILQFIFPTFPVSSINIALTLIVYLNVFPKPKRPKKNE